MLNVIKATPLQSKSLPKMRVVWKSENELGIDKLKELTTIVVVFLADIITILNKKQWFSIPQLVWNLTRHGNVLDIAKEAWEQIKDLSGKEAEEWNIHFAAVLDLENDQTEAIIEQAFAFVPRVYGIIGNAVDLYEKVRALLMDAKGIVGGQVKTLTVNLKVAA